MKKFCCQRILRRTHSTITTPPFKVHSRTIACYSLGPRLEPLKVRYQDYRAGQIRPLHQARHQMPNTAAERMDKCNWLTHKHTVTHHVCIRMYLHEAGQWSTTKSPEEICLQVFMTHKDVALSDDGTTCHTSKYRILQEKKMLTQCLQSSIKAINAMWKAWEWFKRAMYRKSNINSVSKEQQHREGRLGSG